MKDITTKQRAWRKRIEDWSESGLSQADFCRRHGINTKHFYYWKNKLENRNPAAPHPRSGVFMPVEVIEEQPSPGAASILLRINGVEIHYSHDTDTQLLLKVLSLVEART